MDTNALARLLRDGAQGASNAVASNVSAPVNALAWALRKGGLPIPANPVGGSDWMFEKGLMAQPQNKLAGLVGETAGLLGPVVVAAKAPQLAGGLLGMFDNIATPPTLSRQAGVLNVNGLPNRGREVIQSQAEEFAKKLRAQGFQATVEHSGSIAGPSSYVRVVDPQTGTFIKDPVRFSGHAKGAFNTQMVHDVSGPDDIQRYLEMAQQMRANSKPLASSPAPSLLDRAASQGRPQTFDAFKQARDGGADFSKFRAK